MASNLRKRIPAGMRLECPTIFTGAYWRWHAYEGESTYSKNTSILNNRANREWRKLERKLYKQLAPLRYQELLELIAPDQREVIHNGFYDLLHYGEAEAMRCLRHLLVENHLCDELLRVAMDFSLVTVLTPAELFNLEKKRQAIRQENRRKLAKKLQGLYRNFRLTTKHCLEHAANAPNQAPALSLAAA